MKNNRGMTGVESEGLSVIEGGGEDAQAIEETKKRVRSGDESLTLGSFLDALPDLMEERKKTNLSKYGRADHMRELEMRYKAASMRMTKEQKTQHRSAEKLYAKRGFSRGVQLLEFAADNPPDVLKRHVWRLQRNLDEPLFGLAGEPPNSIKTYTYEARANLCRNCVEEIKAAQPEPESWLEQRDRERGNIEWEGRTLQTWKRDLGVLDGFPYEDPRTCEVCGVSELTLWDSKAKKV